MCCETISEKKGTSRLVSWLNGKLDTTIYTGMLLTSDWLIWVHHGDQSGTLLNAANLKLIQAGFYNSRLTKDSGLQISGFLEDAKEGNRGYIGMGPDLAAQKFCEEVIKAIAKTYPPSTQKHMFGFPFSGGGKT